MSIIAISRGSLAAGQTVAELVAERLGYRCYGSEALTEAASQHGVSAPEMTKVLETRPSFWERLSASKEWHTTVLRVAMCDVAEGGNLVYHGLAGQEILKGVGHVLKVRVIAPMPQRIKSVMEAQGLDAEKARKQIEQVDADRAERLRYLFGIDWLDPGLYDLVLNLDSMGVETAAATVIELSQRPEFRPTPETEAQLHDLALGSRVTAAVLQQFPGAAVDVTAHQGVIRLTGNLQALADEREALVQTVRSFPGVREVHADIDFQAMPYYFAP
ncbi:MAG: cytidylate kinase family protein [Chloroflexi bacterium]|nr:cytidylate kinase family protein [Chloroflexota bacterium]